MQHRITQSLVACLTMLSVVACASNTHDARWRTGWIHEVAPPALADNNTATLPCANTVKQGDKLVLVDVAHLRAKRRMALGVPSDANLQPGERVSVDVVHCSLRTQAAE